MVADRHRAQGRKNVSTATERDGGTDEAVTTGRHLVPIFPVMVNKSLTRSRLTDTLFLAHLFATRYQEPQTREKRRADPADANASYRKGAKPPAKPGRYLSKKI